MQNQIELIEIKAGDRHKLNHLFDSPFGGFLAKSILEGQTGNAYADHKEKPSFAVLTLSDVPVIFLGGDATHPLAFDYLNKLPHLTQIFINSPDFIPIAYEAQPGKIVERERWGFAADNLDVAKLQELQSKIPSNYTLKRIDLSLAKRLDDRKNEFANLHGSAFKSAEDFVENGIGYCALKGDELACVGSSFVRCREGIEIQIDTNPKHRGNGLATAVAASLMLYCIENNLEPGWDAATPISASLAKKLGYTPIGEYKMIVFTNSRLWVMLRNIIHGFRRLLKGS